MELEFEDYINIIKEVFIENKSVQEVSQSLSIEANNIYRFVDSILNIGLADDEEDELELANMMFGDLLFVTTENLIKEGYELDSIVEIYMHKFELSENSTKDVMIYDNFSDWEDG